MWSLAKILPVDSPSLNIWMSFLKIPSNFAPSNSLLCSTSWVYISLDLSIYFPRSSYYRNFSNASVFLKKSEYLPLMPPILLRLIWQGFYLISPEPNLRMRYFCTFLGYSWFIIMLWCLMHGDQDNYVLSFWLLSLYKSCQRSLWWSKSLVPFRSGGFPINIIR